MLNRHQRFGKRSEAFAVEYLKQRGYAILARNYRNRFGEIDIIAQQADALVFIEVKARRSDRFGLPQQAVTYAKQRRLSRTALAFLQETGQLNRRCRFDVVSILGGQADAQIEIFPNAFDFAQL